MALANKSLALLGLALVLFTAAIALFLRQQSREPRLDLRPSQALGAVVAQEAHRLVGDRGRIVIVTMDTAHLRARAMEEVLACLVQTLHRQAPALTVAAIEKVDLSRQPVPDFKLFAGVFSGLITKHPNADAIVSLLGPPLVSAANRQQLPAKLPRVLAVTPTEVNPELLLAQVQEAFAAGVVQEAILPRVPPPAATAAKSERELFEQHYQIVTPTTLSELTGS